jgi:non-heme Fe2+,alpha-ketoglutarate-dependent halogenase|tara:strand:- start:399 stop:1211 length:813 start_codon:yes stop_codon:yes gene_type:complete
MNLRQKYDHYGFLTAVDAISSAKAAYYAKKCTEFIEQYSTHSDYSDWTYGRTEMVLRWVAELAAEESLLNVIEDLIGPNILLWNAFLPVKPPHSAANFGWHQDATYWPVEPTNQIITAWVALSPVNLSNGGMQMVRGSHSNGPVAHETTYDKTSMLRRGQQVTIPIDDTKVINIDLIPGQASIHHTLMLHRSSSNESKDWRLGVGFNYASSNVKPLPGYHDSAILLRGDAKGSGFELTEPPKSDLDKAALENFARVQQLQSKRYDDVKQS